jgi:hypothetical protein
LKIDRIAIVASAGGAVALRSEIPPHRIILPVFTRKFRFDLTPVSA